MTQKTQPPTPDKLAKWIFDNSPITAIRVEYRQAGTDTADTICHLSGWDFCGAKAGASKECRPEEVRAVADLRIGYNSVLELKCGIAEQIEAWQKYRKSHARELAEYERLKAKFS